MVVCQKVAARENGDVDVGDREVRACLHHRHRVHVGEPSPQPVGRGERVRGNLFIDDYSARVRRMGIVPGADENVRQCDQNTASPVALVRRRIVRRLDVDWRRIRQSGAIFVSSAFVLCVHAVLGGRHRLDIIEPCVRRGASSVLRPARHVVAILPRILGAARVHPGLVCEWVRPDDVCECGSRLSICIVWGHKEFALLLLQLWKRFGMVVAYSALMVGLLGYGLYTGQSVNAELSFKVPRDWMLGVLGLTWIFNVGLITLYWLSIQKKR